MRRQLAPAFSDSSMKRQEVTITKYVQLFLDKLEEHSQGGKPLDIIQWIHFTMIDIIGDLAFSDSFHSLDNNAYRPWVQSIFLSVPGIEFMRSLGNYPILSLLITLLTAVEKTLARKSQGVEGKSGVRGSASYMIQPTHSGEPGITQEEILAITPILNHCGQRMDPQRNPDSVFPWATYRDPKRFADPDSFSPQRWLQFSHSLYEERFSKDNRDAFKSFSFGNRHCIGQNLAYAEMRLIVSRFLFRFDYKLLPNQQDWHHKQCIYLDWEKGPLNIQLQKRDQV
ncbi:hypothetical protein S40285_03343 [Stachybotrys chlorohalonatus IBT 40285]|uniref:Uncharacterized protein n=1 Tax=Stachybotrys chlorohalonatus (strain IBT 40285) TaxID=1283841 RepID=A0A084R1M3_STAC4|nr:hypothetical protein S40285_03343 [Stachybotrys chlorohalonata IBT 40285]